MYITEATSGEAALSQCGKRRLDIILLSVNLPGVTGFEVTRKLKRSHPRAKIIVLAAHAKPPYPARLLDAGASGYLTRDCDAEELVQAIKIVSGGQRYIGSEAAKQLALSMLSGTSSGSPFEDLSAREMEVMLKITDGHRIPDIASLMCLSPKTVSTYTAFVDGVRLDHLNIPPGRTSFRSISFAIDLGTSFRMPERESETENDANGVPV